MAGFLCKEVKPFNYTFDTDTTVGGTGTGVVRFDNVTAASIGTAFINIMDKEGLNRQDWLEGLVTSTIAGRDLLTLTYKSYTTKTISAISTAEQIDTTTNHGLETGDVVSLSGTDSSPTINGEWKVTKVDDDSFSISGVTIVTAGTTGTVTVLDVYTLTDVVFEITGTSVSVTDGIASLDVDWVEGTLPADGKDVTLEFNKAGMVSSKFWYGNCTRVQEGLGLCSSTSGAWVPAVTVCKEEL